MSLPGVTPAQHAKYVLSYFKKTRRMETYTVRRIGAYYNTWENVMMRLAPLLDEFFGVPAGWSLGPKSLGPEPTSYHAIAENEPIVERWVMLLRVWAEIQIARKEAFEGDGLGSHTKAAK